jgi:hypothetical protein
MPFTLVVLALAACGGESRHGWTRLPAPPQAAAGAMSVWVGDALFYWGGDAEDGGHPVGGLYDPEEGTWEELPVAPIHGRSRAAVAWTGSEVLVCCGQGSPGGAAAYDPRARRWRRLPDAPLSLPEPPAYVWTGKELIIWGSVAPRSPSREGAAYDLATNRWRRIADAPIDLSRAHAGWTGKEMIVLGAPLSSTQARGIAYDPAQDRWRLLRTYPLSPNASTIVWTGRELVAWDYELRAAAYDPARDQWRRLPTLPLDAAECPGESALFGDKVFAAYCWQAATFDVQSRAWRRVPHVPRSLDGRPVPAEDVVYFAGSWPEGGTNTFWEYRP